MKTVGEMLRAAREKNLLTLPDISRQTRITIKYLQAIENNEFGKLPPATFTKGFMQNYARLVNLDPKNVLAVFRRDFDQDERGRIVPRGLSEPVRSPINWFTPTTTTITLSVAFAVLIIAFFIRQLIDFNAAPSLEVTEPTEQAQVQSPVTISGKTHSQASVTINNQPVTVNEDGTFVTQLSFTQGEHTLVVTSTSRGNQVKTLQRIITVLPAQ